mmetsp:Transcript_1560/g.3952  ORF Transcript_1560/g.3952 Transcript_1560/m.3952 type:complete len:90 (+) Transcript_1560:601-870(+)
MEVCISAVDRMVQWSLTVQRDSIPPKVSGRCSHPCSMAVGMQQEVCLEAVCMCAAALIIVARSLHVSASIRFYMLGKRSARCFVNVQVQ